MTVEACANFCSEYTYFGLQYSAECYCGSKLSSSSTLGPDNQCSMTCKGSNSEYCGAGGRTQVYQKNGTAPSLSSVTSSSLTATSFSSSPSSIPTDSLSGYLALGCYNETHDRRALASDSTSGEANTLESCAQYCSSYRYFGVEYSSECYCDNNICSLSIKQNTDDGCSMPCAGDSTETCGGPDFLNIYYSNKTIPITSPTPPSSSTSPTATPTSPIVVPSAGPYTSIGCYNEIPGRALTLNSAANTSMTVELCAAFCFPTAFFGVEYSTECYCGTAIPPSSTPTTDGRCHMPCANNSAEICGGPNGLNMYQLQLNPSSPTSFTPTPTPTTAPPTVGAYSSLGCYAEKPAGRALPTPYYNDSMTIELCAAQAGAGHWTYFGLEYGRECWMGNALDPAAQPVAQAFCGMLCPGNALEWCGAGNDLQLYSSKLSPADTSSVLPTASDAGRG
ncbi:WSC-domain-containing protein [Mytilinidion resinicola]|uniref:WSC-domain-containing protein n=1 Tax=Mytilinidion resinicola TaxID=574789 RepID=A0A6A6YJG2_9PEZI|nr:WSC-domain-containing protein [Mytilinidion resinicola]KAF2808095.1 WSC-domain-containing protein [Mytilinidion resinicola]